MSQLEWVIRQGYTSLAAMKAERDAMSIVAAHAGYLTDSQKEEAARQIQRFWRREISESDLLTALGLTGMTGYSKSNILREAKRGVYRGL